MDNKQAHYMACATSLQVAANIYQNVCPEKLNEVIGVTLEWIRAYSATVPITETQKAAHLESVIQDVGMYLPNEFLKEVRRQLRD